MPLSSPPFCFAAWFAASLAVTSAGLACGSPPPLRPEAVATQPSPTPAEITAETQPTAEQQASPAAPAPAVFTPATQRRVGRVADLAGDLADLVELDLAFSTIDQLEWAEADKATGDGCSGLDLADLATRAPRLRRLRVSGCQAAVHVGLAALTELEGLELADLTFDGVTMGRVASLPRLRELRLTRVQPGSEPVTVLGKLGLERLVLRELATDSPLVEIVGQAPRLRELSLEGAWVGHDAMLVLPRAPLLDTLQLQDTRVGNFSLHQLKSLTALRHITWIGPTFNDHSLLYVRDLPLETFTCACPNFGDAGLKVLGRQLGLRRLALPQSKISGAGLGHLSKLTQLSDVQIDQRELGSDGFQALAELPALTVLTLSLPASVPLADPSLQTLGELRGLVRLHLAIPALDDRAAPQLANLQALEVLDLGNTQISDTGLKHLAGLHQLRELKLHHTRITNRGLAHLADLEHLQVLELDHTDVVDDGVAHLRGLHNLRVLRLDRTLITDAAIPHILAMTQLEQLNLANTVVTAAGVAGLQRLPALRTVNLAGTRAARN